MNLATYLWLFIFLDDIMFGADAKLENQEDEITLWILVTFKENFHEGNVKAGVSFWQYTVFDKTENLLLPV